MALWEVLGIRVSADLQARWCDWLAPRSQPFLVSVGTGPAGSKILNRSDELRDTYLLYGIPSHLRLVWLDESGFRDLPRSERAGLVRQQVVYGRGLVPTVRAWSPVVGDAVREQADGRRFVWWRSLLRRHEEEVVTRFVTGNRRASRHAEVPKSVWKRVAERLPGARDLAGTFPDRSGQNCFGTVMAAAGVEGAERKWMLGEPFGAWLAARTRPGGIDDEPGTVLVWRNRDGDVDHAAVTLGDGYALHKPSQGWMSPTKVLSVREVKRSGAAPGLRLQRYQIVT